MRLKRAMVVSAVLMLGCDNAPPLISGKRFAAEVDRGNVVHVLIHESDASTAIVTTEEKIINGSREFSINWPHEGEYRSELEELLRDTGVEYEYSRTADN